MLDLKKLFEEKGLSLDMIGQVSDGYHTFDSLYDQRRILFSVLCRIFKDQFWKTKKHSDGELCFGGGWFLVGVDTPAGPYTYHYEMKYWDDFDCVEIEMAPEHDGHTDEDVYRLISLTTDQQPSEIESWASREVAIATKNKDDSFYGGKEYTAALEAFELLVKQGHSGSSVHVTKHILNRLIDGKPLTPIEDIPEVWTEVTRMGPKDNGKRTYQCTRMSSLFKYVTTVDGIETVEYNDLDRVIGVDIHNNTTWSSSVPRDIINEMFPIELPYMPASKPYKVYGEDFLTDVKNGDLDTKGYFYMITPSGERIEINRFYKESDIGWDEIEQSEYEARKLVRVLPAHITVDTEEDKKDGITEV